MTAKRVWQCGECHATHSHEWRADECCRPTVRAGYLCPRCDEFHEQIEDAEDCCPQEDNPAKLRAELEQAGQGRLVE